MRTKLLYCAVFAFGLLTASVISACDRSGPLERAGGKVDRTIERGKDNAQDAAEKTRDAVDEAGERAADAIEDATDK